MDWELGISNTIYLSTAISMALLGVVAAMRWRANGAPPFVLMMFASALYFICLSQITPALITSEVLFWYDTGQITHTVMPVLWLLMALLFTRQMPANKLFAFLLWIIPLSTIGLIVFDDQFSLLREGVQVIYYDGQPEVLVNHGPWYLVSLLYSLVLTMLALGYLGYYFFQVHGIYRFHTISLLLVISVPGVANLFDLTHTNPLEPIALVAVVTLPVSVLIFLSMLPFRMFEITPVVRERLLEHTHDGMLVFDDQAYLIDINAPAREFLQIPAGVQVIGKPATEILAGWPEWQRALVKNQHATIKSSLGKQDAQRLLEVNFVPFDDVRLNKGILLLIRDVTTQWQMEQALQRSEDRFRHMIDQMPFPVILAHPDEQRVLFANLPAVQLFALRETNPEGTFHNFYVRPEEGIAAWEELKRSGELRNREIELRRQDGSTFWALITARRDDEVVFIGFSDISERREIADRAQALYRAERERSAELAMLNRISQAVASTLDFNTFLQTLKDIFTAILPIDAFSVAVYDPDNDLITYPLFYEDGVFRDMPMRNHTDYPGLTGAVINTGELVYVPDSLRPEINQRYRIARLGGRPVRSYAGAPLIARGQVFGVLSMQNYQPDAYTDEQINLFQTVAGQVALAFENSRLYDQINAELNQRILTEADLILTNQQLNDQLRENEALQARLEEQATRDSLTRLYNRRYFEETFERELARALREESPLTLVLLDVDAFKQVNDTYGHPAGDALLVELARLLGQQSRRGDLVCRLGGDEFVMVLPGMNRQDAIQRADEWRMQIRTALQGMERQIGGSGNVSVSIGLAWCPQHGKTVTELMRKADQALYRAKRSGRDCVVTAESELSTS